MNIRYNDDIDEHLWILARNLKYDLRKKFLLLVLTLRNVRRKRGAEHGPGDLVFAGYLVRPQPARHGVI